MSVIIGRALPDVRDGLKPVHRRCLFGMWEQGNLHNKPYRSPPASSETCSASTTRTARAPVYDSIVRMAQDFSMRYPLVDGQGNFGSVDGDNAAAMRYTEVRLTRLAAELLGDDIDKETVDWVPELRRLAPGADGPPGQVPEPARQRLDRNRRRAWRRTSRPTTSRRSSTPRSS